MDSKISKVIGSGEFWVIVAILSFSPLLLMQGCLLWEKPHFQFFIFAWGGFAWLVYANTKIEVATSRFRRVAGTCTFGLAVLWAGIAGVKFSPWAAQVAVILLLTGWSFIRLGGIAWTRLAAWSLLLWITVPLPLGYDAAFIQRLQQISSESSAHMLDLLGTPHLRLGNLIELQAGQLFVDEACSGVDSLYSLGAIAILIIVLQRTSLLVALIVLALVPAWAWFGNMTRLTLIAWLLDTWQVDLSHGLKHTWLGLATFATSASALLLTNRFLSQVTASFASSALPRENPFWHKLYNSFVAFPGVASGKPSERRASDTSTGTSEANSNSNFRRFPERVFPSIAMLFLLSGGLSLWNMQYYTVTTNLPHFAKSLVDAVVSGDAFPQELAGAALLRSGGDERNPDSLYGEYSRYWTYVSLNKECLVSLDFPFRGFHSLWECYQNSGHSLVGNPQIVSIELERTNWAFVELELKNDADSPSYLWFTLFDDRGQPVKIPKYEADGGSLKAIIARLRRTVADPSKMEPITFQCQLLVTTVDTLSEDDRNEYRKLFIAALPYAVKASQAIVEKQRAAKP